ncbi:DUF397 domain-containing protein [Streptomyces sp. R302]|uniref:DUF397 domain-containing protein n=1 Tax=unclassified Streptomyces TaxID=2593676 RepID=UPI00145CB351|nr:MULTISPECIES: DUF397 domain-containing protein [unclassified Streptomyces]NML53147.1 DUF397 domain-containing protein [Streptomyces sp. R301]NML82830.1 DUF397 domain-containing protein [Streptomyces sp. R302]
MNSTESLAWFKSGYSGGDSGQCIEVASGAGAVHVRDSKDVARPALRVSHDAWAGFVGLASAE